MTTKSFENLTIVSVTGSSDYVQGSIFAIQRSCDELKGAKGLLICPALPEGVQLPPNIEHREIAPFSYLEYNLFIIYQLDYYINTDYCLLVQNDGWVLDGSKWRDEFWDYDYIGAPVPVYCAHGGEGRFVALATRYYFENLDWRNNPHYIEPQNGGFSLRSKKFLGMPRQLNLHYSIFPPLPVAENDPRHKMKWHCAVHNEDIYLTAYKRYELEKAGIRFAPIELAQSFALESFPLQKVRNASFDDLLGVHLFGVVRLVGYNEIESHVHGWQGTNEELLNVDYIQFFRKRGYKIHVVLHQ